MEYIFIFGVIIVLYSIVVTGWVVYFALHSKTLSKKTNQHISEDLNKSVNILLLGDSVIRGVGSGDAKNSFAGLIEEHAPHVRVTVIAKDGASIRGVIDNLKKYTIVHCDQVIIFCGGMDIIQFSSMKKIREDLNELFSLSKQVSKNVVFLSPPDVGHSEIFMFPLSALYTYRARNFLEHSRLCAKELNITFVDFFSFKNNEYATDKSHPNEKGYRHMFSFFKEHLFLGEK